MENRIAELRRAQNVRQANLAAELGIDASTMWRWEKSKVAIPDVQKVAMAKRFGVSVGYLMGWEPAAADAA